MSKLDLLLQNGIRYRGVGRTEPDKEAASAGEQGDFSRGFEKSMLQIPQTAGGALAYAGDVVGSDAVRDYGLGVYQNYSDKIQGITKDSDSLTNVLQGDASGADWAQNAAGYVSGQALTAIATGGIGGFIGKKVAGMAAGKVAKNMAAKRIAELGMKAGAGSALLGQNLVQTTGSIYPEALAQAQAEGRELDGGDLTRVGVAALGSAGVDTAMDALMIGKALSGARRAGQGIGRTALREVPMGMAREGVTEGIQTGIERVGAGKELGGEGSTAEYVDSVGVGLVGGSLGGAAASVRARKVPETGPLSRAANAGIEGEAQGIESQILQLGYDPQPLVSFPDGSVGTPAQAEQYLMQFPEQERAARQRELMGRDPATGKRIPAPEPEPAAAPMSSEQAERHNIDQWAAKHQPLMLDYAQELINAPGAEGLGLMVMPHPAGKGYTVVPSKWLTPATQSQYQVLQLGDAARLPSPGMEVPGGAIRVDSQGEAAPETYGEQIRTIGAKRIMDAQAEMEADRRATLGTPVPHGTVATPKPVQPILNKQGKPFTVKVAALNAIKGKEATHQVQKVEGGFILAPIVAESQVTPPVTEGAFDAVMPVGTDGSDGRGRGAGLPDGNGEIVGGRSGNADGPDGMGLADAPAPGIETDADPVRAGDAADGQPALSDEAIIAAAVSGADRLGLKGKDRRAHVVEHIAAKWGMTADEVAEDPAIVAALSKRPTKADKTAAVERSVDSLMAGASFDAEQAREAEAKPVSKLEQGRARNAKQEDAVEKAKASLAARQAAKQAPAAEIAGAPIDKEWSAFAPESGTLNVERAEMPQVKAEHRGALVNFLNARGVAHEQAEVPADSLKPTQREFSPAKVQQAREFTGGDRSILVSSDNHILDGHHQWLAKREAGEAVKVIKLDAPIAQLLDDVKEFPSSTVAEGAPAAEVPPAGESEPQATTKQESESVAAPALQAQAGQESAKPKPRTTGKKAAAEREKARADYFTPGNVVKSYTGHDRILSYTSNEDGGFSVEVEAVEQKDGQWIAKDGADGRKRRHSTQPDERTFKAGPVARAAPQAVAGESGPQAIAKQEPAAEKLSKPKKLAERDAKLKAKQEAPAPVAEQAKVEAAPAPQPKLLAERAAKLDAAPKPLTEQHEADMDAAREGTASVESLRAGYQRTLESEAAIKAELNAKKKDDLLRAGGAMFAYRHKNDKKGDIVDALYNDMLEEYTLGTTGGISYIMGGPGGTYKQAKQAAIAKAMENLTDEKVVEFAGKVKAARAERAEQRAAQVKAVANPETLADYRQVIRVKKAEGMSFKEARLSLTPEQRAKFDELTAEEARAERAQQKQVKVEQAMRASGESLTATETIQTRHTKHGHDLWQFNLEQRVSTEEFKDLVAKAKRLGGDYSSYRGNGAIPGWQFRTPEAAAAFKALIAGDASAAQDVAKARRDAFDDDKSQSAVERLNEMADTLDGWANESDSSGRKTNTARRARFAAAAEKHAAGQRALAETMRNVAAAIGSGKAKFLDRVRQKVQVTLLGQLALNARNAAAAHEYPLSKDGNRWSRPSGYEDRLQAAPSVADMDHAEWPSYTAYRSDLAKLGRQLSERDGTKKLGQRLLSVADDVSDSYLKFARENLIKVGAFRTASGERATFKSKDAAEESIARSGYRGKAIVLPVKRGENVIVLSPSEARERGIWEGDDDARITLAQDFGAELVAAAGRINRNRAQVDLPWIFETTHQRLNMLTRMGIETPAELRAALREFMQVKVAPKEADKVKELERAMTGRRKDGLDFFPTPATQADEMVSAAGIEEGMRVLEPSAGMGHIADRIREAGVDPEVVEMSPERRELLEAKGYEVVGSDFMDLTDAEGYDRIVMNPPFSDRRDAAHVMHAFDLLKPGGRLVAIMGEGVFFGQDSKAVSFRAWLEAHGGTSEKLAEGTFMDPSLPVNTSVNARMVVIDKEGARREEPAPSEQGVTLSDITSDRRTQTIEVDGVRRPIHNSKGQKVASDFKGQMNFWKWFGDSQVVDEKGAPLVVYHGTDGDFMEFRTEGNNGQGEDFLLDGAFFSDNPEAANEFGSHKGGTNLISAYLSLKNPLEREMSDDGQGVDADWRNPISEQDVIQEARAAGHDGVIFRSSLTGERYFVAFKPEQIKSATGNDGSFNPASASITHDLMADSGLAPEQSKSLAALVKEGAPAGSLRAKVAAIMEKNAPAGVDKVKSQIAAAKKSGQLDASVADFALWALAQNPHLARDLDIDIQDKDGGQSGSYKSIERLMTLFGQDANPGTAVHEILHHAERMMPQAVQQGIASEWFRAYQAAWVKADAKTRRALEDMLAMDRNRAAFDRVLKAFESGTLDYNEHYPLSNASEYWAVNATSILARRYQAASWIAKAKVWLQEMVEKVKGLLGLESDAKILAALDGIIKGDGKFVSPNMLTQLEIQMDVKDSDFEAWFKGSKAVGKDGKPLTLYHGTNSSFGIFDPARTGAATGVNDGPHGIYFTDDPEYASEYGSNVVQVHALLKNPYVWEGSGSDATVLDDMGMNSDEFTTWLKDQGHDGFVSKVDGITEYVVFSPEQVRRAPSANLSDMKDQTRSAAFRKWFGASKVVDGKGEPLRVFHGTRGDFDVFTPNSKDEHALGVFFTSSPFIAGDVYANEGGHHLNTDNLRAALDKMGFGSTEPTDDIANAAWDFADKVRRVDRNFKWMPEDDGTSYTDQIIGEIEDWVESSVEDGPARAVAQVLGQPVNKNAPDANVIPAYLSMQNPLEIDGAGMAFDQEEQAGWIAQAKSEGHDGLVIRNYEDGGFGTVDNYVSAGRHTVYIAFKPEQVKSAVGNDGSFSPDNPSILRDIPANIRDYGQRMGASQKATDRVADLFATEKTFNSWWHKTVGTQYHKAQTDKDFKRVYDATQRYLASVSLIANQAADLAPTLLPKLEGFRDLGKQPPKKADLDKASQAIFAGTLLWTRDAHGKPVQVKKLEEDAKKLNTKQRAQVLLKKGVITEEQNKAWLESPLDFYESAINNRYESSELKAGIVWTDSELRSIFNATDEQIKLYREFRASTDRSLDDMGKTELVRYAGSAFADTHDAIMEARDVVEASEILRDAMLTVGQAEQAQEAIDKGTRYNELKLDGYAPLMRFGEHTVYVRGKDGEQLYFGMYETAREAAKAARELQAEFPEAKVTKGILSKEASKLFAGISPDTIEVFANVTGLAENPLFQDYLKLVVNNRSALKRLIHRKGIEGYSEDASRVLASFVTSNARAASKNLHHGEMVNAAEAIPNNKGDVKDEAIKLVEYIQNPTDEAAGIRGLLFANFIGGSIASAAVNMTQPLTMTLPYLAQFGAGKAVKLMGQALKMAAAGDASITDAQLKLALTQAENQGHVSPQEIHHLQAEAMRSSKGISIGDKELLSPLATRKLAVVWGGLFGLAEQFNRKVTFIAAYQIARDFTRAQFEKAGVKDAYEFAVKSIAETQGTYNRGNRPNWARGALGATLMTFKQYSISYLEFLKRLPNRERALALGILILLAGANGLPFADDLDDLIDTIGQALGYNLNTKRARERFAVRILGQGGAEFVTKGISGVSGMPLDVSMRMGMQNLLPMTGIFLKSNTDKGYQFSELGGAAGALAQRGIKATDNLLAGDVGGAASAISPTAIANLTKGLDMLSTGMYRDARGRKVIDTDTADAMVKMIGFQPNEVAKVQDDLGMIRETVAVAKSVRERIAQEWAEAEFEGDRQAGKKAREQVIEWNRKNPDSPISVSRGQIMRRLRAMRMEKRERSLNAAPRSMRAALQEDMEEE